MGTADAYIPRWWNKPLSSSGHIQNTRMIVAGRQLVALASAMQ
jgi:hypothetical protein